MTTLNQNLVAAVREALEAPSDGTTHLSVQRRIEEDGAESWTVVIDDCFRSDLTHFTDNLDRDCPNGTAERIAQFVAESWDDDWDVIDDGHGRYVNRSVFEEDEAA